MSYPAIIDQTTLEQWVNQKLDQKSVEQQLYAMGFDDLMVAEHIKAYRRLIYAKRQFMGFIFLGTGAFLGFISCVLTIVNPAPELYNVILYGLTSVALIIIFIGLYMVFN